LDDPNEEQRTITLTYQQYAEIMGLTNDNAYQRLKSISRELMTRTVEIINPTGEISERIFQWVNYAEFNREKQAVKLRFSKEIVPHLFQLKRFIKYNLNHVKAFENKYSMRVYEWLLKELTQKNACRTRIEISIAEFKFMFMLEKKYKDLRDFNRKILKLVEKDLNTHSNIKLKIEKLGRPASTLVFECELNNFEGFLAEKASEKACREEKPVAANSANRLYSSLQKALIDEVSVRVQLTQFELKFLSDLKSKHDLTGSFSWLSIKQRNTLEIILAKYGYL
ncbi:MAG: replication initiation protein, partial [Enterovibrio sp.]